MSLSCAEVEGRIDLYAAGECDAATGAAVARHLTRCRACARTYRGAQQLLGLLDVRHQEEERLRRLRSRIEAEGRRKAAPARVLPFLRRAAALAALVVLTFGLSRTMDTGLSPSAAGVEVVLSLRHVDQGFEALAPARGGHERAPKAPGARLAFDASGRPDLRGDSPAEFRRELLAGARTGRPASPPSVSLELEVRNTGEREKTLWVGGGELELDLRGPGVLRVPAPDKLPQSFMAEEKLTLKPGERRALPVTRLAAGARGRVNYLYWTEPGEYTLTARLRTAVSTGPEGAAPVTLSSPPVAVRVEAAAGR